jgi:hypothetical protein
MRQDDSRDEGKDEDAGRREHAEDDEDQEQPYEQLHGVDPKKRPLARPEGGWVGQWRD